jgi:RES domain-containing protein
MRIWRLMRRDFAPGLDGEGARLWGGRWNSVGKPAVYCAQSPSLALLEAFVHLPRDVRQSADHLFTLVGLEVPTEPVQVAEMSEAEEDCRRLGNAWLAACSDLALSVPSVIVPYERSVILNPRHPAMAKVQVAVQEPFRLDPRLS